MKMNQSAAAVLCLCLAGALSLNACGQSKKTETPATTTAGKAAVTTAAATETATTAAAAKDAAAPLTASLNYDYANAVGEDFNALSALFGNPSDDTSDETNRVVKFSKDNVGAALYTDDEDVNPGREGCVWLIEANAGDIFSMSGDAKTADEFFKALVPDDKPVEKGANNLDGYTFGGKNQKVWCFSVGGYQCQIIPESNGGISKKSRAVIITTIDADKSEDNNDE